jgi:hypothetical protein
LKGLLVVDPTDEDEQSPRKKGSPKKGQDRSQIKVTSAKHARAGLLFIC